MNENEVDTLISLIKNAEPTTLESVKMVRSLLTNIQSLMNNLDELKVGGESVGDLFDKYKLFDSTFTKLARLSYNGDLPPNLRKELPKIKSWLENIEDALNRETSNKKTILDLSEVDKYKDYCEKIEYYFNDVFPMKYENVSQKAENILNNFSLLKKNMKHFKLPDDLVDADLLRSEDSELKLVQPKSLSGIKNIVSKFASFIKKVKVMISELESLADDLGDIDMKEFFASLNKRNLLLKSLLKNFANLNQTIYNGNFSNNLNIRNRYNELLSECINKYPIPDTFVNKLQLDTLSPVDQEVNRSMSRIRERAFSEPVDTFVSPWQKPVENSPVLEEKEVSKSPLSKEDKNKYESLWDAPIGDKISPEEKSKYEALWAFRSALNIIKMAKR
jgi:hypothetical protein